MVTLKYCVKTIMYSFFGNNTLNNNGSVVLTSPTSDAVL